MRDQRQRNAAHRADPEDGLAQLVSASAQAVSLLDRAYAAQQRNWQRGLGEWSNDELRSFAAQLGRFNGDLG